MKLSRTIVSLAIALFFGLSTYAHNFEVDGIYYNITSDNEVEVTTPENPDEYSGSITVPETVYFSGTQYSVISIGDDAFYKCIGLESIEIPNSVTTIGRRAFYGTGWFNNQPDGIIYLDNYCLGYKGEQPQGNLKIKENTRLIADSAFEDCDGLTSIEIPNSVTTIGSDTFSRCSGLTNVEIPSSVISIGSGAFSWCDGLESIEIPNSVTSIGSGAFSGCDGLTSIEIPNSVTSIGSGAFSGCSELTTLNIPESVVEIGESILDGTAWYYNQPDVMLYLDNCCVGCKGNIIISGEIVIKEGTRLICSEPFMNNNHNEVSKISIPNSVTSIGEGFSYGCKSLEIIELLGENPVYDQREDCNAIIETATNTLIAGCKSSIIPNSVTSIGPEAFISCGLTGIEIPNSVITIGHGAFQYTDITSIEIPNSVTKIGIYAFDGCDGLTTVTIGNSVNTIEFGAFFLCFSLTEINCKATTPPMLEQYRKYTVFNSYSATLNVPIGCAEAYRNAVEWCNFTNIQEIEFSGVENVEVGVEFGVAVNGNEICITGIDSLQAISIYDMRGTLVYCGNDVNVSVPASGLYLVKVGNQTAKVLVK